MRAAELPEILNAPLGKYFVARNFAGWYPNPAQIGLAVWGSPRADDISPLLRLLVAAMRSGHPRKSLVDMEHLSGISPTAFGAMASHVAKNRERLGASIVQQAVVRPAGLIGAIVAGFHSITASQHPVALFDSLEPALAWLDTEPDSEFCRFARAIHRERKLECSSPTQAALSSREREVSALAAQGQSNKEIAYALGITHSTVRVLLARAAQKIGSG